MCVCVCVVGCALRMRFNLLECKGCTACWDCLNRAQQPSLTTLAHARPRPACVPHSALQSQSHTNKHISFQSTNIKSVPAMIQGHSLHTSRHHQTSSRPTTQPSARAFAARQRHHRWHDRVVKPIVCSAADCAQYASVAVQVCAAEMILLFCCLFHL